MSENNMTAPENNMPGEFDPKRPFLSDGNYIIQQNPLLSAEIKLPLGTSFNTGPTHNFHCDKEVTIGILGELERLIFELKDRVTKLEVYQSATAARIETLLSSIENKLSGTGLFEIRF